MADLSTSWLGLTLRSPVVVAASPLSDDPDALAAAVDAGAGAVVLRSVFEEAVTIEQMAVHHFMDAHTDWNAEASSVLPDVALFAMGAKPALTRLARARKRVDVPVIASLNGTTPGGWTTIARQFADAGADAIELNLYEVATSATESGAEVEARQLAVVASVVAAVGVPVTVKLGMTYTALPEFVSRLADVGARGVTVFNRFYQPDLDLHGLDVVPRLELSTSVELLPRLNALAILASQARLDLGCTGGVHTGDDAAKAITAGAHVVQVASALLKHGPSYVGTIHQELSAALDGHGWTSVAQARGVMSMTSSPDPHAWQRLNYMKVLDGWKPRAWR
jgi:dihydroorotate dehydrogenase (fumarate)